ncbi:MAG: 50S ribosomal protein L25 [Planctomycetes bacterium]|nr:50S ribosomal protein L25 [Planctomycetota bacterium]
MSATQSYPSHPRTDMGRKATAKLRASGKVPITIVKAGSPSRHASLDEGSANHLAAHVVHLCKVDVEGKSITVLRSEIVKNCLTDKIQHIDLIAVDEKSDIKVDVFVRPDARNCPGVKAGGIVEQRMRKVRVQCKANAIPDELELDLSDVQITETVYADKITLPAGVKLAVPPKQPVLTVVIPRQMVAAETATAGATPAAGAAPADGAAAAGDAKAAEGAKPDAKAAAPAKDAKADAKGDKKK